MCDYRILFALTVIFGPFAVLFIFVATLDRREVAIRHIGQPGSVAMVGADSAAVCVPGYYPSDGGRP